MEELAHTSVLHIWRVKQIVGFVRAVYILVPMFWNWRPPDSSLRTVSMCVFPCVCSDYTQLVRGDANSISILAVNPFQECNSPPGPCQVECWKPGYCIPPWTREVTQRVPVHSVYSQSDAVAQSLETSLRRANGQADVRTSTQRARKTLAGVGTSGSRMPRSSLDIMQERVWVGLGRHSRNGNMTGLWCESVGRSKHQKRNESALVILCKLSQ